MSDTLLPMVLRHGPCDGARNGDEFTFHDGAYPKRLKMPGVLVDKAVWRSAIYRMTEKKQMHHGVECVVYEFEKWDSVTVFVK